MRSARRGRGHRQVEDSARPQQVGRGFGGGLSNNVNVQEAKEFKVVIELLRDKLPDEVRNNLKPGMTATAQITTKVQQNVLAVPLQAIVEKKPETSGSPGAKATPTPTPLPNGEKRKGSKRLFLEGNKASLSKDERDHGE